MSGDTGEDRGREGTLIASGSQCETHQEAKDRPTTISGDITVEYCRVLFVCWFF